MPSSDDIAHQQELLDINRKKLRKLVNQASRMGVFAPPYVLVEIDETRADIAQIEATLHGWGIAFKDLPDEQPAQPPAAEQPARAQRRPNPFRSAGKVSDPARFVGREQLLRELFEDIGRGINRALLGEAQVGKSSILAMICQRGPQQLGLPPERFVPIDMQSIRDEGEFFEALCDGLGLRETLRGFRLSRELRGRGGRWIVCLDEIEKMSHANFSGDERSELRGLADGADTPLTLLVASRTPLDHLFPDRPGDTSPLYNICPALDVGPFTTDEAHRFLALHLAGCDVAFDEPAIAGLIAQSGGHPARLQQAAAALYERHCAGCA